MSTFNYQIELEKACGNKYRYIRSTEVDVLIGDFSKAKKELGWKPKKKFEDLVRIMVEADLELAKKEAHMGAYISRGTRHSERAFEERARSEWQRRNGKANGVKDG